MTTPDHVLNPDSDDSHFAAAYPDATGTFGLAIGRTADETRRVAEFYVETASDGAAPGLFENDGMVATLNLAQANDLRERLDRWLSEHPVTRFLGDSDVEPDSAAVVEELETGLTPEQDTRVSALHQAAGVVARLIEASQPKAGSGVHANVSVESDDVLALARWVVAGDAAVEPVLVNSAELAADR